MAVKAQAGPKSLSGVLKKDVAARMVTPSQAREVTKQQRLFARHRKSIERQFRGKIVAHAGAKRYVGLSVADIVNQIAAVDPYLVFYAEEIPK